MIEDLIDKRASTLENERFIFEQQGMINRKSEIFF